MTIAAFLLAVATPSITAASLIDLSSRAVRVRDVVSGVDRVEANAVVAMLPTDGALVSVSRAALAVLVRRRVPALLIAAAPGSVMLRAPATRAGSAASCRALRADAAAGAAITTAMVTAVPCTDAPHAALRYDVASATARAAAALPAGSYLGRVSATPSAGITKGSALRLISIAGPVRVRRQVTALQSSRGTRVFVRDADGQVFAAPLVIEEPK